MLKSVIFQGLENQPELRKRIDAVMPMVEQVLSIRARHISIIWGPPRIDNQIQFEIRDDLFGVTNTVLPGTLNEKDVRWDVRDLHFELLHRHLQRRVEQLDQNNLSPVGGWAGVAWFPGAPHLGRAAGAVPPYSLLPQTL